MGVFRLHGERFGLFAQFLQHLVAKSEEIIIKLSESLFERYITVFTVNFHYDKHIGIN